MDLTNSVAQAEGWVSLRDLDRAARECLRRKGARRDAIAFRMRYGEELLALRERLVAETYRPEPGIVFVTDRPKLREVHAAVFRDRVVHHLLHGLIAPRFERGWSPRSFACRKGMGTHAAFRTVERLVHDATRRGSERAWALQLDIKSFFPTVHKPTLLRLLAAKFSREERRSPLFRLLETIVTHDCTAGARRCGRLEWFDHVPPHKRLGHFGPQRGLPIGNLTSQFFAGVYLAGLDHFVERTLGLGAYVRYMDDLVIVHRDRERLRAAHESIRTYLQRERGLDLRGDARLAPVSEGVDFVGYVARPRYTLARRRVIGNMLAKAGEHEQRLAPIVVREGATFLFEGAVELRGPAIVQRIHVLRIERTVASWNSFFGHLRFARGERTVRRALARAPRTQVLARLCGPGQRRLRRRFAAPRLDASFRAQLRRLRQGLGACVLVVQRGARFELERVRLALSLGLRRFRMHGGRRRACATRPELARCIELGLARGLSFAIALERRSRGASPRWRELRAVVEPQV